MAPNRMGFGVTISAADSLMVRHSAGVLAWSKKWSKGEETESMPQPIPASSMTSMALPISRSGT